MRLKKIITGLNILWMAGIFILLPGQDFTQAVPSQEVKGMSISIPRKDLPSIDKSTAEPVLTAQGAIVVDVDSGVVLYQKNPQEKLMPASTTKIMTALVALDEFELNEVITVKNEQYSIGNKSDLVAGEKITVENALKALLIGSGNDVALALGQHHPQGYNHFIDLMNQKASNLHLKNSQFTNVSGVEGEGHYTTAKDLSILAREAMKNEVFKNIVATKSETITDIEGKIKHPLHNTNELLGVVPGVNGIKTGWTSEAGECLVTNVERGGRNIITVVLKSQDRFRESEELIEWTFMHTTWSPFPLEAIQSLPEPRQDQLQAP